MKIYILLFVSLIILLLACNNTDINKDKYQQTKAQLAKTERKNPAEFLKIKEHDKKNLIGKTVIKGVFTNNATACTYKDVLIEISFISKTGSLLEKDEETIYDSIPPNENVEFKTKYFAPKETVAISLKVLSATCN